MKPLKDLVTLQLIDDLASRSHFRFGKQIYKDNEIKIIKENTFNYMAEIKMKSKTPINVAIMSTTKGFRYKCDCSNKKNFFCEHCVALGLYLLEQTQPDEV